MTEKQQLIALKIFGCVFFFLVVSVIEFLVLREISRSHMRPTGVGWIVIPITSAIFGYKYFPSLIAQARVKYDDMNNKYRNVVGLFFVWTVCVFGFIIIADPFRYEWQWGTIFKWWLLPVALLYIIRKILSWMRGDL